MHKFLKIILLLILLLFLFLVPPVVKIFYNVYANWLTTTFNINSLINLYDDNYYFTFISAILNTFIIGFLSYKMFLLDRESNLNKKRILKSILIEKIENNINTIIDNNLLSTQTNIVLFDESEYELINEIKISKSNKETLIKLLKDINNISNQNSNNSSNSDIVKNFISSYCSNDNEIKIKKEYNQIINKIKEYKL